MENTKSKKIIFIVLGILLMALLVIIFVILTPNAPQKEENIKKIVAEYKAAIAEATHFVQLYAEEERKIREMTDNALNMEVFEKRTAGLFELD